MAQKLWFRWSLYGNWKTAFRVLELFSETLTVRFRPLTFVLCSGKSWSKLLTVWSIAPNATFFIVMSSSKIFWSCQRPSRQRSLILAVDRSIKIRVSLISPERHSTTHLNGSWHENTMDTDRRSGRVVSCSTLLSQVLFLTFNSKF